MTKRGIDIKGGTPASDHFGRFAANASYWLGSKWAFLLAGLIIAAWAISGPVFRYSDTWQLVINTGTTIVTFLMVFLIQNTQNRDARAINLKLDELIRAVDKARDQMMNIEKLSDVELDVLEAQFEQMRAAGSRRQARKKDLAADDPCRTEACSDDLEQKQDQNDDEDKANATPTVVTHSGPYAIATVSKPKNEHDQDDDE